MFHENTVIPGDKRRGVRSNRCNYLGELRQFIAVWAEFLDNFMQLGTIPLALLILVSVSFSSNAQKECFEQHLLYSLPNVMCCIWQGTYIAPFPSDIEPRQRTLGVPNRVEVDIFPDDLIE